MDGRDADDLAGLPREDGIDALADHRPRGGSRAEEHAGQVDAEHGVPLLEGHLGEGGIALEPGVADQDVDATPGPEHLGQHGLDLGLPGNVGANGAGLGAAGLEVVDDPRGGVGVAGVVHDDVGAGGGQRPRDALADARAGAGDERLLSLQRELHEGA